MRLFSRRRPAGAEWVPNDLLTPEVVQLPLGPTVLRLGPGFGLLDLPSRQPFGSVANVWIADGQWLEAEWPRCPTNGWFVAPVDLRLGHVLEFRHQVSVIAGWVADVTADRFVFVVTADRSRAWEMAGLAFDRWSRSEIDRLR